MKDISLSRVGQLLIVTIALLAAGCAGLRITPSADLTPIPDTTGSHFLVFGEGVLWSVQYEPKPGFYLEHYPHNYNYYVLRIDPETRFFDNRVTNNDNVKKSKPCLTSLEGEMVDKDSRVPAKYVQFEKGKGCPW